MLDLDKLAIEPFTVKIDDTEYDLTGLKICDFEKLIALPADVNGTVESAVIILNANDRGKKFDRKEVTQCFNLKQLNVLVNEYYRWLNDTKSNPN